MPITEAIALFGTVSVTTAYRFADQPWCAAAATPRIADREPQAARDAGEGDRRDEDRADASKVSLRASGDVDAAPDQRRRQPPAADAADVGKDIDRRPAAARRS